jgi:hypothetical protein
MLSGVVYGHISRVIVESRLSIYAVWISESYPPDGIPSVWASVNVPALHLPSLFTCRIHSMILSILPLSVRS